MSKKEQQQVQFDETTFLTPSVDGLALCGHKLKCHTCSRKILVQMVLFGQPHHLDLTVICGECLQVDKDFREQYPELSKDLEDWKNGS